MLRIIYSAWFIHTRAAHQQLLEWAPHRTTLVLLAAAAFVAGLVTQDFAAEWLLPKGSCQAKSHHLPPCRRLKQGLHGYPPAQLHTYFMGIARYVLGARPCHR